MNKSFLYSCFCVSDCLSPLNSWTKAEIKLALQIANERKINLSAQSIKGAKKIKEIPQQFRSTIQVTASSFWIIAAFSIVNSVLIRKNVNFHLPGLAMTEIFEIASSKVFGELLPVK